MVISPFTGNPLQREFFCLNFLTFVRVSSIQYKLEHPAAPAEGVNFGYSFLSASLYTTKGPYEFQDF